MSSQGRLEGIVVRKSLRNVRVRVDGEELLCSVRGRFREGGRASPAGGGKDSKMPVVVGDRVRLSPTSAGEAVLEEILPRRSELRRARALAGRAGTGRRRSARPGRTNVQQVVAANVDQVLSVQASVSPLPSWPLVDRVIISCEWETVVPGICLNKWDQVAGHEAAAQMLIECLAVYSDLGFATFRTSGLERLGLEQLGAWLEGKTTVLSGHSGVGKSTLLNALCPEYDAATGAISTYTGKGRHVTTAVSWYDLPDGGALIDTPGYREYGLIDLEPRDVGAYYAEFREHIGKCRFKDCLHVDEPSCAVLAAVDAGQIAELRYDNYLSVLDSQDG